MANWRPEILINQRDDAHKAFVDAQSATMEAWQKFQGPPRTTLQKLSCLRVQMPSYPVGWAEPFAKPIEA